MGEKPQPKVMTVFDLLYLTFAIATGLGLTRLFDIQHFWGQLWVCVCGFIIFQFTLGNLIALLRRRSLH